MRLDLKPQALLASVIATSLCHAQIPSISPPCPKPTFTVPVGSNVTFTWLPVTTDAGGTALTGPITYNLYNVAGPAPALLASGLTGTTTTRNNLAAGSPCYALSAVLNSNESTLSSVITFNVATVPAAPTSLNCTFQLPAAGTTITGHCTPAP